VPLTVDQEGVTMHDHDPREEDDEARGEELEAAMLRADRPAGADRFGTTAEEEATEEGLERALAQERPEPEATDEVLSLPDDGAAHEEKDLVGDGVTVRDDFAAPEEAAMSERGRAPGATDHEDPHPAEDDRDDDAT
jgi:hypothetical protein